MSNLSPIYSASSLLAGPSNISQSLFMADEKVAGEENSNLKALINQSRLSTYYQDNPYGTLTFSNKFQLPTLGGEISEQTPGHRPGNIFKGVNVPERNFRNQDKKQDSTIKTANVQGIIMPNNMARW
jgi:hypothetical protein